MCFLILMELSRELIETYHLFLLLATTPLHRSVGMDNNYLKKNVLEAFLSQKNGYQYLVDNNYTVISIFTNPLLIYYIIPSPL